LEREARGEDHECNGCGDVGPTPELHVASMVSLV
jgi:hypothetical protein